MTNAPQAGTTKRRLAKADAAAAYLDISTWRLYELVRRDQVPHTRYGPKQLRFDLDALDIWIAKGGSIEAGAWRKEADKSEEGRWLSRNGAS